MYTLVVLPDPDNVRTALRRMRSELSMEDFVAELSAWAARSAETVRVVGTHVILNPREDAADLGGEVPSTTDEVSQLRAGVLHETV